MKYFALILSLFLSTPCFAAIGDTSGYNLVYSTDNIGDEQLSGSFIAFDPQGTPPAPNTKEFLEWRQQRFNYWVDRAENATVDITYYFADASSGGNDANNGLTELTPKETLSAANALLVDGNRVEILFDRGSKFLGGILAPNTGTFKFGAYGTGAKPIITTFNGTGYSDADNAWTLDTGNMYRKTTVPTKAIGWIREVTTPYNPYMYLTTTALVQLMPYSWTQTIGTGVFTADSGTDVFTDNSHGLANDQIIWLSNSGGGLPGNTSARTNYFVINQTANTFQISTTQGGSAVNLSSNGTGTNSWNTMTGLYINMGGTDPNTVNLEVTPDFNDHTEGWAQTQGDGTGNIYYVEDIIFDGQGAVPGQDNSIAVYGVHAGVTGSDLFVANRVETYYNGRHGIGHTSGAVDGGVFVVKDSGAGYCSIDATSFVSFAGGNGFESHYEGTYNPFGKLPSNDYAGIVGGAVYSGGPTTSGIYAHTGGTTLGMFSVWQHEFQDNRGTYSRATYEIGDITAANLPGTYNNLSSIRAWFNHTPIARLIEIPSATVTADAGTDIISQAGNTYADGDVVMFSSTGTVPGGTTAHRPYHVLNRDASGYQLGTDSLNVSSVDASTDVITMASATAWSNGSRVKIRAEWGQLPGGLNDSTLYYIVGLSSANLQLSLTSGGAPVDITDAGFGRFRVYGGIVNISSAGTGTISSSGVSRLSGYVRALYSSPVVYINNAKTGFNYQAYGSAVNNFSFNEILNVVNVGNSTASIHGGGGLDYYGHYKMRARGSFWWLNAISNGNAQLFNSIVDNQGFITALNVTNATTNMRGNAYFDPGNVIPALTTADDYRVFLTSSPVVGATPGSTFDTEGYPSPSGILLEYDFFFNDRNTTNPSMGPIRGNS